MWGGSVGELVRKNGCPVKYMPSNVRGFFLDLKVEYIIKSTRGPQLTTSILGWRCTVRSPFHVYLVINASELYRVRSLSTISRTFKETAYYLA